MNISTPPTEYFQLQAAAFIRGWLAHKEVLAPTHPLRQKPLEMLSGEALQELINLAHQHELRIHRFKRTMELPRVHKVLGILKGMQPANLLDVGSGRGAFLWPLLDTFPYLPVTAIDILDYRVADMHMAQEGGLHLLTALQANVTQLPFANNTFDVVTMLEVLEHVPDTERALRELCRIAKRFLILTVPSREDDNPEHIHLFTPDRLTKLLHQQGIQRVTIDYVPKHLLIVARTDHANK
ncbi:class I SAM-dependent methyltransferase [Ktedonospora formicarum]|uniref:Methyltransferase type 11 domain-containing protein n=1 Tax=Ktedonospora formicarum TaxID=2778364 RepID=A0A8J3MR36_9CHLR|nr:class I SAM-dependent methyltransferase [Ktedonospora formicarum]GHO43258.1 hypothetical protein KSX_14210 [Ktedonospora formicarum]